LNFDSNAFLQTASSDLTDVTNFLGSVSDNSGFLGAANGVLTGINDTTSGILPQATTSITGEISSLGDKITADQTQINLLQQNLMAQMASADAAIATLEQQASYFQMMFQTQNANAQLGL
jgi:flagellar capping protein FliD